MITNLSGHLGTMLSFQDSRVLEAFNPSLNLPINAPSTGSFHFAFQIWCTCLPSIIFLTMKTRFSFEQCLHNAGNLCCIHMEVIFFSIGGNSCHTSKFYAQLNYFISISCTASAVVFFLSVKIFSSLSKALFELIFLCSSIFPARRKDSVVHT